ncbi:unnamed protein product [Periconia digitata]|uniref:Uncharacterized protein n=1 Tax=Periconia digitata TaxID=1303443 RepID=A0A9W4XT83_9PLEO|nr:unnamed protein product [Periconia digitata]
MEGCTPRVRSCRSTSASETSRFALIVQMKNRIYALSLLFASFSHAETQCYYPDGSTIQDTPCTSAPDSTCCGLGYACLSNNLCALTEHVPGNNEARRHKYIQASCTDKTFASPNCPRFCLGPNNDGSGIRGLGVTKCGMGDTTDHYYCSTEATENVTNTELCRNSEYYFESSASPSTITIIGTIPTPTLVASKSTSSSSITTPAISSPDSPKSIESKEPSDGIGQTPHSVSSAELHNLGLGLGLGLGIPLLLAIAIAIFFYQRQRQRQLQRRHELSSEYTGTHHNIDNIDSKRSYSLNKDASFSELSAAACPQEVDGNACYELWAPKQEIDHPHQHEYPSQ